MTHISTSSSQKLVQNGHVSHQSHIPIHEVECRRRRGLVREPESLDFHREGQRIVVNQDDCMRQKSECCAGYAFGRAVYGTFFTSSNHGEITMHNPVVRREYCVPVGMKLRKGQVPDRAIIDRERREWKQQRSNSHCKFVESHWARYPPRGLGERKGRKVGHWGGWPVGGTQKKTGTGRWERLFGAIFVYFMTCQCIRGVEIFTKSPSTPTPLRCQIPLGGPLGVIQRCCFSQQRTDGRKPTLVSGYNGAWGRDW